MDKGVMIGVKIEELTASGFVTLLDIETDNPEEDIEIQNEHICDMTKVLYEAEKFHVISNSGIGLCIKGVENKTLRVTKIMDTDILLNDKE